MPISLHSSHVHTAPKFDCQFTFQSGSVQSTVQVTTAFYNRTEFYKPKQQAQRCLISVTYNVDMATLQEHAKYHSKQIKQWVC